MKTLLALMMGAGTALAQATPDAPAVAIETVEPPTNTGSSTANGVALPLPPIDTAMSSKVVDFSSGANLKAIAHRG